jgi:4-amino-4-deoxy-L-arabinose transferase-like glycosyltransferase
MSSDWSSPLDSRRSFITVVVAATLLHVVLAVATPVSGDEAYYWDCSRHLDWSYFDQPPLVIWTMIPFRAVLGECRLAVRAPAVLASLLIGVFMLPLARRLGGGYRHATLAYLVLHGTPLFFLGSFYCSTDIAMGAAYLAATWAAVALAQGETRAWWGFGVAVGLGFLAKFPVVIVAAALAPALLRGAAGRDLRSPTPYLAAALSGALTLPVWLWGARHEWANIIFQLAGRHDPSGFTLRYLGELLAGDLLLLTPFLAVAAAVAWWLSRRKGDIGWVVVRVAAIAPLVFFGLVGLRTRVAPHWVAPGIMVAFVMLPFVGFRWRRGLQLAGVVVGVLVSLAVVAVVLAPEALLDVEWTYRGRPNRISTGALSDLVGNQEIADRVAAARRPGELVASQSYSEVHMIAFLSGGTVATRLAHVTGGTHGLASLYWHRPSELEGRDVLFVTDRDDVEARLQPLFEAVEEQPPIDIVRGGRVVRTMRLFSCRNLLRAAPAFSRLED